MQTHHLEYMEGGILDMDDLLSDLVEDRDKVRKTRTQTLTLQQKDFLVMFLLCVYLSAVLCYPFHPLFVTCD